MQQAAEPTRTRRRCEWVQQIVVVVARASWSWEVVRGGARDGVGMGAAATGGSCVARTNQTTVIFVVAGNILFGFLLLLFAAERASHFFSNFWFICNVCVCVCACVRACLCVLACCPMGGGCRNSPRLNGPFNES